jgi:hypothetical protein
MNFLRERFDDTSPEIHPIQESPPLEQEERIRLLEIHLAQLWDEVWWHQLPPWRRSWYWLLGYRSPITKFYEKGE